jgi:hypothetical protein
MTAEDWANLGILGEQIGLQIYATTHPGTTIATPPQTAQVNLPGVQASFNTNLLIIGGVIVLLVVLSK